MSTLTALHEATFSGKPSTVDRDKGIIFGVKVIGTDSSRGYRYPLETLQDAVSRKLYEGVKVNVNHLLESGALRPAEDRFGQLLNARFESDGIYADLGEERAGLHVGAFSQRELKHVADRRINDLGVKHTRDGWGVLSRCRVARGCCANQDQVRHGVAALNGGLVEPVNARCDMRCDSCGNVLLHQFTNATSRHRCAVE